MEVGRYVGVAKTLIFIGPDNGLGPYVPIAGVSPIGLALLSARDAADARQILGAAVSAPSKIQPINLGGTGQTDPVSAATALGVLLNGAVKTKTNSYTAQLGDGVILANAAGGGFALTFPRVLGVDAKTKVFVVLKLGDDSNVVSIQDDAGVPVVKMALVTGGQAFAIVVVKGSTVYAAGVV